jgi:hypothetical protein
LSLGIVYLSLMVSYTNVPHEDAGNGEFVQSNLMHMAKPCIDARLLRFDLHDGLGQTSTGPAKRAYWKKLDESVIVSNVGPDRV